MAVELERIHTVNGRSVALFKRMWNVDSGRSVFFFLLSLALFLLVWEGLSQAHLVSKYIPSATQVVKTGFEDLKDPFYDYGPNDKGIGLQLLSSLKRVLLGFALASIVAVPLGFFLGISEVASKVADPYIQVLRPVSPLAWLPIGLAVFQDSEMAAIFVIFICSIWPTLLNTIFAIRDVNREYLDVARVLRADRLTTIKSVIFPAAAPAIVTGLRISVGIAWLVIVAAEMLIGGTGIGYYVWNSWNNLDIAAIMVAILYIGLIGIALDRGMGYAQKRVSYEEA
jgi:nitrate/nitrite transport system permease protein